MSTHSDWAGSGNYARRMQYLSNSGYSEDSDYTSDINCPTAGQGPNAAASQYLQDQSYLDTGQPYPDRNELLLKGVQDNSHTSVDPANQSRNLEGPPQGFNSSELPGGPGGPHYPPRGGQGENTDQYYAEQYDQYYRYGWDDQFYEYDDTGQYEYEGWFQDEYGEWHQDPVYKEYYDSLEKDKTDPNNSASKHDDKKTDNSSGASELRNLKESNKEGSVKDLNKKNIENKPSDNYYIPYGEEYHHQGWHQNDLGDWLQESQQNAESSNSRSNKENDSKAANRSVEPPAEKSEESGKASTDHVCDGGVPGSKNNAPDCKTMPANITSRPKPQDYEEAWYEEPSDGQWYNSYDWYEDENGEWAYDYRMEEYGYVQNEQGEWVPGNPSSSWCSARIWSRIQSWELHGPGEHQPPGLGT